MPDHKLDVLCVLGTRPEVVKLVPLVEALQRRNVRVGALLTGQHANLLDPELAARLAAIGLANLGVASDGSVLGFLNKVQRPLLDALDLAKPRCVVVQGDTMSAMAGAEAAHIARVPIAHIEAGVRSGNLRDPWPEEGIRTQIDELATWRYPATEHAARNIGMPGATGNTGIDVLRESGVTPRAESGPTLLVTLHRRELRERADVLETLRALVQTANAEGVTLCWPVHPGLEPLVVALGFPVPGVRPPLSHHALLHVLSEARGVLTDSGGVTEEAATLGVPTAILRACNDRPEAVAAGVAMRFDPTPEGVAHAVRTLARRVLPRKPTAVYGTGHAADAIAAHLAAMLGSR